MNEPSGRDPDVTVLRMILDRLNAIDARIDKLVSAEAFDAERRRVDDRHTDLRNDIVDEREARMKDTAGLRDAAAKTSATVRWLFASIVLPVAAIVAMIVMNLRGPS